MSLNQSQIYYVKKAVGRKARVVVAAINRVLGQGGACITNRIVRNRINKELRLKYGISRLQDIPAEDFEKVIKMIKTYRFFYNNKHFG